MTGERRLVVGLVRGFHGLRGELRVEALSDRAEDRFEPGRTLYAEGSETPLTIAASEPDSLGWRLRFKEVASRDAAEALRDTYLEAVVAPGEELPRGEYYWHDVVGCRVVDLGGRALGEVVDMYRAGGAEVMLVRGPAGELDIPVVRAVVRIFAPKRGEIVVDTDALGLGDTGERDEAGPRPNGEPAGDGSADAAPSADPPRAGSSAG